jgi:hypothetical protein
MKTSLFVLALATMFSTAAHAAFYVDEDTPQVTATTALATVAKPAKQSEVSIDVAFIPKRAWISNGGKKSLKENLEEIKLAEAVSVTTFANSPANPAVQKSRGTAIRQWLIANGVQSTKVIVNEDPIALDTDNADFATVTLTQAQSTDTAAARAAAARSSLNKPTSSTPTPVLAVYQPAPKPAAPAKPDAAINDSLKMKLVQRIIAMSQNKLVKAEDAVNMVAEILKMQDTNPGTVPAVETVRMPPATIVELPRSWVLDHKKSVRENIEEWARVAKWEAPNWQSVTAFNIEASATLNGTFIEVLGQLANAIPSLDFKANKTLRTLVVADTRKP